MSGQPRANRVDHTSLIVGLGMAALTVCGVASVFGDAIAALFAPPAAAPLAHETEGAPSSNALPEPNAADAGARSLDQPHVAE
ncbi:MAG TPA: hypothetical protein VMU50_14475 [Polyangia bacterium]|nr:hypothetical protein [Polyangia bacterium]